MVKVLFVTEPLVKNSGVTSVVLNIIRNINDKTIHIDLLTFPGGDQNVEEELASIGCKLSYLKCNKLSNLFAIFKECDSFFRSNYYDIVHSHFNQIDYVLFMAAKKNGINNLISHSHNSKLSDSKFKAIRNRILFLGVPRLATVWAACSTVAGECLFGSTFNSSEKKYIIHNGVDCKKYRYDSKNRVLIREEFGYSDSDIVIGHVGGFREQKNHEFLIRLFKELHVRNSNYKLLLVGDGKLKESIKQQVIQYGLTQAITFAGTRDDVSTILSGIDLFILPSFYEGLPVVGIEAQANGLACVFSDTISREVDLASKNYFISLKEGVTTWCDRIFDIDYSHDMACAELVVNKGYDITMECKRLASFYHELTK